MGIDVGICLELCYFPTVLFFVLVYLMMVVGGSLAHSSGVPQVFAVDSSA